MDNQRCAHRRTKVAPLSLSLSDSLSMPLVLPVVGCGGVGGCPFYLHSLLKRLQFWRPHILTPEPTTQSAKQHGVRGDNSGRQGARWDVMEIG